MCKPLLSILVATLLILGCLSTNRSHHRSPSTDLQQPKTRGTISWEWSYPPEAYQGEKVPIRLQVVNNSSVSEQITIQIISTTDFPTVPPRNFFLAPGERREETLYVVVPTNISPGEYRFKLKLGEASQEIKINILPKTREYIIDYSLNIENSGASEAYDVKIYFPILPNTPYQEAHLVESPTLDYQLDEDLNRVGVVSLPTIPPNSKVRIPIKYRVKTTTMTLKPRQRAGFPTNSPQLSRYLAPSDKIESDHPLIEKEAKKALGPENIAGRVLGEYEKAKLLYNHVRNIMQYKPQKERRGALQALLTRQGDCEEYTDLFIAMARSLGLPARRLHGWSYNRRTGEWEGHAWAEVYVDGVWVPSDLTWGLEKNGSKTDHFGRITADHVIFRVGEGSPPLGNALYRWEYKYQGEPPELRVTQNLRIEPVG